MAQDCRPFLAMQSELAAVPYVADVARLEWAINEARHAPEAATAGAWPDPDSLGRPGRLVFSIDPSVRFVESAWPIDQVWRANCADTLETIELECRGCWLVVYRDGDGDISWMPLPEAAFVFVRAARDWPSAGAGKRHSPGLSTRPSRRSRCSRP